jgi:hypothetical protein
VAAGAVNLFQSSPLEEAVPTAETQVQCKGLTAEFAEPHNARCFGIKRRNFEGME